MKKLTLSRTCYKILSWSECQTALADVWNVQMLRVPYRFRSDEHVRDVFVLAEQREMQDDLQRLRVRRHHDEFGDASIQRLRRLVGA